VKRITLLGSTGSIGVNALDVIQRFPDRFQVVGLAAGRNLELLAAQATAFAPGLLSVLHESDVSRLRAMLPPTWRGEIVWGEWGAKAVAAMPEADVAVVAMVGAAGLSPTLAAIAAGKHIALANKETLVMAGSLVMAEIAARGLSLLPIDSEHSAIFQALRAGERSEAAKIILTASGGPFYGRTAEALERVTVAEALNHPRWRMGKKISIDSATMMNKALEIIEARWLFAMPPRDIEVLVHPQSVVHSLVEFHDGSVIAQLGEADMRVPIAYALSYPERLPLSVPRLSLKAWSRLDFLPLDDKNFPAVSMAYAALESGGAASVILNAANEVAVEAFLQGRIAFSAIRRVVAEALQHLNAAADSVDAVFAADASARVWAEEYIQRRQPSA
jgi:1-deoxy-D-xylulose-5-phosphate reductoisomerase